MDHLRLVISKSSSTLFPPAPARTPGRKKQMKLGEVPWLLMINWDISMPLTNLLDTPTLQPLLL